MGVNEKSYVGIIITTVVVFGWYFLEAYTAAASGLTAVADFGFTMWVMMGVYVALIIAVMIVSAIISKKDGGEMGEFDERDSLIDMRAERMGSYVQATGLFGLLVMVMAEVSTFMLAHTILGIMVFSTMFTFVVRLYLYRKGV